MIKAYAAFERNGKLKPFEYDLRILAVTILKSRSNIAAFVTMI